MSQNNNINDFMDACRKNDIERLKMLLEAGICFDQGLNILVNLDDSHQAIELLINHGCRITRNAVANAATIVMKRIESIKAACPFSFILSTPLKYNFQIVSQCESNCG